MDGSFKKITIRVRSTCSVNVNEKKQRRSTLPLIHILITQRVREKEALTDNRLRRQTCVFSAPEKRASPPHKPSLFEQNIKN